MDTRKLLLIGTALTVAIGSAIGVNLLIRQDGAPSANAATAPANGPMVLVATRLLPVGTIVSADAFRYQPWPQELIENAYYLKDQTDLQKLVGTVVRNPITAGQPVTRGSLVHPKERGFLAAALQPGMRAVTVQVNAEQSVAGFVFPGDRVDLLLTQNIEVGESDAGKIKASETIVRNIRVLATDQSMTSVDAEGKETAKVVGLVTLEATPKIAERLAVAQAMGQIRLALRPLADSAGDLDAAIATGEIVVPRNATPADEARMARAIAERPVGSTAGGLTASDVSPTFARIRAVELAAERRERAREEAQMARQDRQQIMADRQLMLAPPRVGATAMPSIAAPGVAAVPTGPVVRVTRGNQTSVVAVGTN